MHWYKQDCEKHHSHDYFDKASWMWVKKRWSIYTRKGHKMERKKRVPAEQIDIKTKSMQVHASTE